jgi:hypothetical protein
LSASMRTASRASSVVVTSASSRKASTAR